LPALRFEVYPPKKEGYSYISECTSLYNRGVIGGTPLCQDLRIAGSQYLRIAGSQDLRVAGSQDLRIPGSQDSRIPRGPLGNLSGYQDCRVSGLQYLSTSGLQDLRISGLQDLRIAKFQGPRIAAGVAGDSPAMLCTLISHRNKMSSPVICNENATRIHQVSIVATSTILLHAAHLCMLR
jgi:hypothetical protein